MNEKRFSVAQHVKHIVDSVTPGNTKKEIVLAVKDAVGNMILETMDIFKQKMPNGGDMRQVAEIIKNMTYDQHLKWQKIAKKANTRLGMNLVNENAYRLAIQYKLRAFGK